jgi:hypothetical protein
LPAAVDAAIVHGVSLEATRELAEALGVDQLELLRANRDRPWMVESGVLAFASVRPGDVFRHPNGGEIEIDRMGEATTLMLGGLSDFAAFDQPGSSFDTAWKVVAGQIQAEGGDTTAVQTAASDFVDAYQQMTSGSAGFGVLTSDALKYAQDFTIAGRTVLGAVNHVQGLIAAAQGANTPAEVAQVFNMFTGTLVGAVVAAGAVSAGVGSLIVAGVGVAMELLASSGLLGTAPTGTLVCQSGGAKMVVNPTPTIQVGCATTTSGKVINQGAANWRTFPKKNSTIPGDADWFNASSSYWHGDSWGGWPSLRLVDSAFPVYHYMACNQVPSELSGFNQMWTQAWTANAEYALNGLKAQEDAQVLLHCVRIWNRAHTSASYYDLTPATFFGGTDAAAIYHPSLAEIKAGRNQFGGSLCDPQGGTSNKPIPFYPSLLMSRVRDLVSANDSANNMVGGNLRVYTGAPAPIYKRDASGAVYKLDPASGQWALVLTAQQAAALAAAFQAAYDKEKAAKAKAAAGMSTGGKVAVGAGVVALGGAGLWLGLGHSLSVAAVQSAFGRLLGKVGL